MKTVILIAFLAILSTAAFGQYGGLAGTTVQPVTGPTYSVPDHPAHASQGDLRPETSLLGNNNVTTAHGERPLYEFGTLKVEPSLGDVARAYRELHAKAEKATIVFEKQ